MHTTIIRSRHLRVTRFSASETNIVHLLLPRQTRAQSWAFFFCLFIFVFSSLVYYCWYYYCIVFIYSHRFSRRPSPVRPSTSTAAHVTRDRNGSLCTYYYPRALVTLLRLFFYLFIFFPARNRVVTFSVVVLSRVRYTLRRGDGRARRRRQPTEKKKNDAYRKNLP